MKLQKNTVHLLSVCALKSDLSVDPRAILFLDITGTAECLPAASCEPERGRHKVMEELTLDSKKIHILYNACHKILKFQLPTFLLALIIIRLLLARTLR